MQRTYRIPSPRTGTNRSLSGCPTDMPDIEHPNTASAQALVQIGSYRIVQQLGSGGMSSVFRAVHAETGHEVALKVLPRSLAKNATLLQRFLREAKSAESLEHPNIVAIFDRGTEQGRYYLVLEYVPGGDLHERVRVGGPLAVGEAVSIIRGVVEGLRYAAGLGLIHRDIKPANILLAADGQPKVADLGLAVQLDQEDERVTRDGTTVGTVDYMAPEQARDSRATSVRSDIYSLGCTFYHILTGSAPFGGGDVPDKLRRHASEPPPDVRRARPDVPEALALLIQRMMAKKPDARFRDYDELAAALDALPVPHANGNGQPVYALIDEDEGPDVIGSKPEVPLGSTAEAGTLNPPPRRPARPAAPALQPDEVNLAELAALVDDEPAARPPRARRPSPPVLPAPSLDDDLIPLAGAPAAVPRRLDETTLRDLILRGVMLGVAIVLVGFGLAQLIQFQMRQPESLSQPEVASEEEAQVEPVSREVPPATPRPGPRPEPAAPEPDVVWVEPADALPGEPPAEPPLPPGVEALVQPDWTRADRAIDGPTVTVRRLDPTRDRAPSLTRALESIGGTTDIADRGPFFEAITQVGRKSRRIAARQGARSALVIEPPPPGATRDRSALYVLDGQDVVIERLDIVVPVGAFPQHLNALFQVRTGSLTLRDCTLTLVGPPERRFAAFRLGSPTDTASGSAPSLRLERTLVQGQAMSLIEYAGKLGRAWLSRSVALCGEAPGVVAAPIEGPSSPRSRELLLHRSVLAGRKPAIELAPPAAGVAPLSVVAAGSTLARVQGGPCPMIATHGGTVRSLLDWAGDANRYAGWNGWMAPLAAPIPAAAGISRVADLSAARTIWRSDTESQELPAPWPDPHPRSWTRDDLEARAPEALPTLRRAAWPEPRLTTDTVTTYPRLETSERVPTADRTIDFEASDPRFAGDLGRFLAAQDWSGIKTLAVEVRGQGAHALSPFRVPEGASLSVTVPPPAPGAAPLTWFAPLDAATSLLSVRGGTLSLSGVRLRGVGTGPLVEVEEGNLRMSRCVIEGTAPFDPRTPGEPLLRFRAASTRALGRPAIGDQPAIEPGPLPSAVLTDCVVMAPGMALRAEVGCGVVALRNCAIVGGGSVIDLAPLAVSRDRFRADLQLDRCTLVAGRGFVRFGPWPGSPEGPSRPWLISSVRTAFLDAFEHAPGVWMERPALLRADPDALARGAVSWQADGDAYQVSSFLAPGELPPPQTPGGADIVRDWVGLWGQAHIVGVSGPARGRPNITVGLRGERLRPGPVALADLAVQAIGPGKGRVPEVGADLQWANVTAQPTPAPAPPGPQPRTRPRNLGPLRRSDIARPF
jgi:serine/threonine protein kinase